MNYFSKNIKTLRTQLNLSQEAFGLLFDLSKSNVKSYESGFFPKLEKFIQIMDHFALDPSKFILLDMETESVRRSDQSTDDSREEMINRFVTSGVAKQDQFKYLDDFTPAQLKDLLIKTTQAKEELLKENLSIKDKYTALLEKFPDLKG